MIKQEVRLVMVWSDYADRMTTRLQSEMDTIIGTDGNEQGMNIRTR